jgi:rubrerythrin
MGRGRLGTGLKNNPIRVLAEIILSGNDGITQEELSSNLAIDRTTVYRITQKWEKKGKIRKNSEGRYSRYIANTNAIQDVVVSSHFQAQWAAFQTLKSRRIERISQFADFKTLQSADPMTIAIFLFSVKIGTLITYLLKEALNPKSQFLSKMMDNEKDNLTDDQKYELTLAWLRNCFRITLPAILYRFREAVFKEIATKESSQDHKDIFDRLLHLMKTNPRHIFSDDVHGLACRAFSDSFPIISHELDRMTKRVPPLVESIYEGGYIERAEPDISRATQTKVHNRRMKKNHTHQFTLLQVRNNKKLNRCRVCGEERTESVQSRRKKAYGTDNS